MKSTGTDIFSQRVRAHLRPLRGEPAILDADLAWFLGIEPAEIIAAVEQNPAQFPADFVFHLTPEELAAWERESPCVTGGSSLSCVNRLAFTTHGAGMLLTVFTDERFTLAAIPVLRVFADFWKEPGNVLAVKPACKS